MFVMSQTFTLKGRASYLSFDFNPPIELDSRYTYSLALISPSTWNSIPNIEPGCNKLDYSINGAPKVLTFPTGSYEIADIGTYLQI